MPRIVVLILAALSLLTVSAAQAREDGFLMFGGPIHAVLDLGDPAPEALVVRDGKVAFVGRLTEARRLAQGLPEIDLKGAAAYPGFIDSHVHLTGVGLREMTLNLDQVASVAELVAVVKARDAAHPGAEPQIGRAHV